MLAPYISVHRFMTRATFRSPISNLYATKR